MRWPSSACLGWLGDVDFHSADTARDYVIKPCPNPSEDKSDCSVKNGEHDDGPDAQSGADDGTLSDAHLGARKGRSDESEQREQTAEQ